MAGKNANDIEVANLAKDEQDASSKTPIQEAIEEDAEFGQSPPSKVKEPPAPSAPEPVKAPEPPKHNRYLVRQAQKHGATADQINATDPEDLEMWVEEQDFAADARRNAPEPKKAEPVKTDVDDELGLDKAVVEAWDKDFTGLMRKIVKENKELKEHVKAQGEREVARDRKSIDDQIDNAFESLGGDYQKMLGSGTFEELAHSKAVEAKRRIAVFNAAGIDVKKLPPGKVLAKKLKAAADELFGLQSKDTEEASVYEEVAKAAPLVKRGKYTKEDLDEAALAAPVSRENNLRPGRLAALKHIKERQALTSREDDMNEELNGRVPE